MAKERWTPPPMKPAGAANQAASPDKNETKVTVDEHVVRKMLKVNPALRQGRTTSQVKKSLERGDPLLGKPPAASAATASNEQPSAPGGASELRDTVSFFLRSKLDTLSVKEAEIEARRKSLDAELETTRTALRDQIKSFFNLLDQSALAKHGPAALAEHAKALQRVGLNPAGLVDAARRSKA